MALELDIDTESIAAYLGALRAGYPVLILEPGQLSDKKGIVATWRPDIRIPVGTPSCPPPHHLPDDDTIAPHPDLRVLLSTSGSTGDPKLVRLSACNIASNANSIAEYLNLTPQDRAATTLPLHYSYGLSVLNSYLAAGASLFLSRQSVIEPAFWGEARAAGVTSLALVPHQVELLAHSGFAGDELPTLRYMTQAGGKLVPDLVRRFDMMSRTYGWPFYIMYGQTEAAPRISFVPPDALPSAADTIGRAIPGGRLWLADEHGTEIVTPNCAGELVYAGPNVMMGYATTRSDLALGQGVNDLRTGDVAELTDSGYFRIVGRIKRFVKLYGLRISLDQIEAFLYGRGIPVQAVAVEDRLVILHHEEAQGVAVVAALTGKFDLPPAAFHTGFLAEVPRLSSGKPDYAALRGIASEVLSASLDTSKKQSEVETLDELLQRVTRSSSVGPTDSFSSLGGDSLSYLHMQLALEDRLGEAPQGWEDMPLSKLTTLASATRGSTSSRVRIGVDVPLRLAAIAMVVIQHATDYSVFGGTWILIALMGYSMARFQLSQIAAGKPFRLVARLFYPIIPLYFVLLAAYGLFRGNIPVSYLLLLGNYKIWSQGSLLEVYWFVSLYAQFVVVMALVAAMPFFRTSVVRNPWGSVVLAATANVAALVAVALWQDKFGLSYHPQRGLLECLSVFLFGWLAYFWKGSLQFVTTGIIAAISLGLLVHIGMPASTSFLLGFTLILLGFKSKFSLPAGLGRGLTTLASVTLFVYLLHEIFVFFILKAVLPQPVTAALALILSFCAAIIVQNIMDIFEAWRIRTYSRRI